MVGPGDIGLDGVEIAVINDTGSTAGVPPGPAIVVEFPTTYSVSGSVVDGATGDAIVGARIHAELVGQTTEVLIR